MMQEVRARGPAPLATALTGDAATPGVRRPARSPIRPPARPSPPTHTLPQMPEFSLRRVEVVAYDEADRLFEMGFAEQLHEVSKQLAEERQVRVGSGRGGRDH